MIKKGLFILIIISIGLTAFFARGIFSSPKDSSEYFTIYREYGELYFKEEDDDTYSLLFTDSSVELPSRSFVRTGKGIAHIVFPNDSMFTLGEHSEVQVIIEEQKVITVNQYSGKSWHRVSQYSFETYNVQTPLSMIRTTNSKFGVYIEKIKEFSVVTDGEVDIRRIDEQGSSASIGTNYMAEITHNKDSITISEITKKLSENEWYIKNELIDKLYETLKPDEFVKKLQSNEATQELINMYARDIGIAEKDLEKIIFGDDGDYEESEGEDEISDNNDSDAENTNDHEESNDSTESDTSDNTQNPEEIPQDTPNQEDQPENEENDSPPVSAAFEVELINRLKYYLDLPNNSGKGFCSRYKKKSAEDILSELTSIEDKYKQEHTVADKYRATITETKTACSDGIIDEAERAIITSLMPADFNFVQKPSDEVPDDADPENTDNEHKPPGSPPAGMP